MQRKTRRTTWQGTVDSADHDKTGQHKEGQDETRHDKTLRGTAGGKRHAETRRDYSNQNQIGTHLNPLFEGACRQHNDNFQTPLTDVSCL